MYVVITGVFLGGMIPLVLGIIHYARENRKLDALNKAKDH